MEQRQFQEAVTFVQEALEDNPSDPELLQLYGRALLRNQQPSLAVWPLRRVFHDQGLEGPALVPLVEALARGGAPAEAVQLATEGLAKDPSNWVLLRLRSAANLASLNHEAALADIDLNIVEAPIDAEAGGGVGVFGGVFVGAAVGDYLYRFVGAARVEGRRR